MKKSDKVWLIVLSILAVLLFGALFVVRTLQAEQQKVTVELPVSTLTGSLFESQNTVYVEDEGLSETLLLTHIPYQVDVPDVENAVSGNGVIYNFGAHYMMYVSELQNADKKTVLSEYSKAVLMTATDENCTYTDVLSEVGYLNGFEMEYFIMKCKISDGNVVEERCIVGYIIQIPDYDYDLVLAVGSDVYSTSTLENAKACADALVKTIQYNKELAAHLAKIEELENSEEDSSDGEVSAETGQVSPLPGIPANATTVEETVTLTTDYENLSVTVRWDNADTMVDLKLYNSTKAFFYTPTSYDRGVAVFDNLGQILAGEYYMEIYGADYGEVNYEFVDAVSTEGDSGVDEPTDEGSETTGGNDESVSENTGMVGGNV